MSEIVSLAEAARRLGTSERTIRRRLHSGELSGQHIDSPTGWRWLVELPEEPVVVQPGPPDEESRALVVQDAVQGMATLTRMEEKLDRLLALLEAPAAMPPPAPHTPPWRRVLEKFLFGTPH